MFDNVNWPNLGCRYDILTTDISKFIVVYAFLYLAFFLAVQTINRSYERYFEDHALSPGGFNDTDNCGKFVQSINDGGYRLFTLTFGDSLLETILAGVASPSNTCGGLQVTESNYSVAAAIQ